MSSTNDLNTQLEHLRCRLGASLPSAPLFHYTDTAGVLGIVEGSLQWATNALFLNDEGEIVHATRLVADLYGRELAAHPSRVKPDLPSEFKEHNDIDWTIREFLHRLWSLNEGGWFGVNAYVCCFCQVDDLLSQWRAYGDRGGGFSIGFDASSLLDAARAGHAGALLGPVIYDRNDQIRVIEEIYRTVKQSLLASLDAAGLTSSGPDPAASITANHAEAFTREVFLHAPFFKQETFEAEKEWRLVLTDPLVGGVRFRPHTIAPIPYVEVPLSSSTVVSLRIGPRRDHALTRRSLELLTAGRSIEILSSEVTLR
jgi:hypothetical protein